MSGVELFGRDDPNTQVESDFRFATGEARQACGGHLRSCDAFVYPRYLPRSDSDRLGELLDLQFLLLPGFHRGRARLGSAPLLPLPTSRYWNGWTLKQVIP